MRASSAFFISSKSGISVIVGAECRAAPTARCLDSIDRARVSRIDGNVTNMALVPKFSSS